MTQTVRTIRILGIDPGSHRTGVGCIEKTSAGLRLVLAETIQAPDLPLLDRLPPIQRRLKEILAWFQPHEIAIEDIFHAKNARSAFFLGTARGVAIGACLEHAAAIFEYAPTLVKSTVTGHGRADKIQIQKMVRLILGAHDPLGFDATDALAVAICHAHSKRWEQRK